MQEAGLWIKPEMKAKNHFELLKYALAFRALQMKQCKPEEASGRLYNKDHTLNVLDDSASGTWFLGLCDFPQASL